MGGEIKIQFGCIRLDRYFIILIKFLENKKKIIGSNFFFIDFMFYYIRLN